MSLLTISHESLILHAMNYHKWGFPDENLLAISREPWFADIVNYLVTNQTPSHWSKNDIYTGSYPKSSISFGRNRIFLSTVLTKLLGDAFPMRRLRVFYPFVTNLHAVDTLVPARLLKSATKRVLLAHFVKDAYEFCKTCPRCQMVGRISKRNMMPLNPIL